VYTLRRRAIAANGRRRDSRRGEHQPYAGLSIRSRSVRDGGGLMLYRFQSRNESRSCDSVDLRAAAVVAGFWFSAAIAAKSGSCGAGAAFDPGFQPGGKARGTQSAYSRTQVPSAMTASNPSSRRR